MKYDFDRAFPQPGTTDPMHKKLATRFGITDPEAMCYGVAEMKFEVLPEIKQALRDTVEAGFFGYSSDTSAYVPAVKRWMKVRHDWDIEADEIVNTHGVVTAIGAAVRAFTKEGDNVIIQTPVYDPFGGQVRGNERVVLENPLVRKENGYEIDFEDFEAKAKLPNTTMFVMCSPHNPVGRVWTKEELEKIAKICCENGVLVVSDEIHNDIVYPGFKHTVFAKISPEAEQNCIVCTAPSKTFNIPGLALSNIIIKNPDLRAKFAAEVSRGAGHFMNSLGMAAAGAAFENGDEWVDEMCAYTANNAKKLEEYLAEYLPGAWVPKMEGTYLAWIDFSFLGMSDEELEKFMRETVKVSVNCGFRYGTGGSQFVRVNIGCPERYVLDFVKKVAEAVEKL